MEIVYAISALASAIAALLAWLAKLVWAKEYTRAKDETIRAKEAEIAVLKEQLSSLRELTPMRIREYFISVKEQLEEYVDQLKNQIADNERQLEIKVSELKDLSAKDTQNMERIEQLRRDRDKLETNIEQLQFRLSCSPDSDQVDSLVKSLQKLSRLEKARLDELYEMGEIKYI